jgi:acetolactate synthase-1/2/3 large subunit
MQNRNRFAHKSGAEYAATLLKELGVEVVFTVPGNQINPLLFAFTELGVRVVTCRHEAGAVAMSEAYSRLSKKVSVVLVIPGAGVSNCGTGLLEAVTSNAPVLLLTARQSGPELLRRHDRMFHSLDHNQFAASLGCNFESVNVAHELAGAISRAAIALRRPRPRPTVIEVLEAALLESPAPSSLEVVCVGACGSASDGQLSNAVNLLVESAKVVIVAGRAVFCSNAVDALESFANSLGAPVITTTMGKGVFNEFEDLYLGKLYEHGCRAIVEEADLLVIVGSRLSQVDTDDWAIRLPSRVLRIDPDATETDYWVKPEVALVGDLAVTLRELASRLCGTRATDESWKSRVRECRKANTQAETLLAAILNQALPKKSVVCVDINEEGYPLVEHYRTAAADEFHFSGISLGLGMSLSAGVGAKLANPLSNVVVICGDGGFIFGLPELATVVDQGLLMTIVIVNDGAYGTIKRRQLLDYGKTIGVDLKNPDFADVASTFGFSYERVESVEQLKAALASCPRSARIIEVQKDMLRAGPL